MTHRHVVLVACLVLALLAAPSIVAQETPTATATANTTNETESAGMGTQMTAFLQSSSAAANDSVENGMWEARFNQSNASERARLVTNRTGSLEQRLERLEAQNETVQQRYENGTLSEQAYIARQSQLNARIDALQSAVNDTDEAAAQTGVNDSRLERLKTNASQLRGQQVAGIARGLGAGPPAQAGPPSDRGPSGDRTTGPPSDRGPSGDRTTGPPADEGGPAGPSTNTTSNSTSDGAGAASGNSGGGNSGNSGGGNAGNSGGGNSGGGSGGSGGGSGGGGPP